MDPSIRETAAQSRADAPIEEPQAALERALIAEFLEKAGHTWQSIAKLPADEQESLLRAAAGFATLKLSEIESRARFVEEME